VPHTPRFPALALFGRRLSEAGHDLGIPASENLHRSGQQTTKRRPPPNRTPLGCPELTPSGMPAGRR
jgi:hypothetical protein